MLQSTEWNNHESVLVWGCLVCGDILLVYLLNGNLLFMKFRQTSYFSFIEGMCRRYSGEIIRLSLCRMQPHHASSRILFFFWHPFYTWRKFESTSAALHPIHMQYAFRFHFQTNFIQCHSGWFQVAFSSRFFTQNGNISMQVDFAFFVIVTNMLSYAYIRLLLNWMLSLLPLVLQRRVAGEAAIFHLSHVAVTTA